MGGGARSTARRAVGLVTAGPYGLLVAVLLLPTACFLALPFVPQAFGQGTGGGALGAFRLAYQGNVVVALINSLWIGGAAGAAALLAGVVLAWLCERVRIPGAAVWRLGVWLLLLVPTYLSALGLEDLLAPRGVVTSLTGWYPAPLDHLLRSAAGVVAVLALRGVAFTYVAVAGVMRSMGREESDAARVHGLRRRRAALIQLSSLAPALAAGFVLVFAETVSDFGVASTLAADAHVPVITYAIFTFAAAVPIDLPSAAAVSWSLIAVFAALLLGQRRLLGRRDFSGGPGRAPGMRSRWDGPASAAALGTGVFFALALLGPGLGIAASSLLGGSASSGGAVAASGSSGLSLAAYRQLFAAPSMLAPVWLSLGLGLAGATVTVAVGLALNLWNQFRAGAGVAAAVDVGLVAVIGLPSIVLGAGFVFFYDLPVVYDVLPIYDTQWLLLVGYVVGFTPIAVRMLQGPLAQAGRTLYDAGRVHGLRAVPAWARAVLPAMWRSLVSVWLFLVAVIMFELPLSEVLHAPTGDPLAVTVAVKLKSQVATGTALTVVGIVAVVAVLAAVTGLQWLVGESHRLWRARLAAEAPHLP